MVFGNFSELPYKLQHPGGVYHTPDNHLLISAYMELTVVYSKKMHEIFVSATVGTYQGLVSHVE